MSDAPFESAELPPGTYTGTLMMSRIVRSWRSKSVGVALYWDVQLRHGKKRVWRTLWLSPAALPRTKRELAQLGVRTLADLDNDPPVPAGAICKLVIADRRDRDGYVETRIVHWEVLSDAGVALEVAEDDRG